MTQATASTSSMAATHPTGQTGLAERAQRFARQNALGVVLTALIAVAAAFTPAMLSLDNLYNIAIQFAPLAMVVVGQAMVIMVRGLDLSVSSVMATAAVIATQFSGVDTDMPLVLLAVLAMGAAVGTINGLLITKRGVSPFLATLASMIVLQGARNAWTQGAPSGNVPPLLIALGSQASFGIPNNFFVLIAIAVVAYVLLHRATFGRRMRIVGGGPEAARLVGINVDRTTLIAYVICSMFAAFSGLVLSGFVGVVDNWVGKGFELDSIVAAVLGGIALSGGKGGVPGALFGTAILVILSNAVVIAGLPVHFQLVLKGVIIVVAATLYVAKVKASR